jgi:uncharacterized membrane protein
MTDELQEKNIYRIFEIGVILKGLNALLEIVLGGLLLFVNVSDVIQVLIANELVEDPDNFLAMHLQPLAPHLSPQAQLYSALYLLAHGLIKVVLVWGLLKNKTWAYPATLTILALFVAYQGITFLGTHSIPLALLTVFDLALMWLIFHEYRRIRLAARLSV